MKALVKFHLMILLLSSPLTVAYGACCDIYSFPCKETSLGIVLLESNKDLNDEYSYITLNGEGIYKIKTSRIRFNWDCELSKVNGKYIGAKAIISYSKKGGCITEYGEPFDCDANIIIDFTGKKPVISNESFLKQVNLILVGRHGGS